MTSSDYVHLKLKVSKIHGSNIKGRQTKICLLCFPITLALQKFSVSGSACKRNKCHITVHEVCRALKN